MLCYSACWHCCILVVPRKVTNSLLVLLKETGKTPWLTIAISLFSSCMKMGLCVWLDKTFNWEETLLIVVSEGKCPLNKTIYWWNHIINAAINLNHCILMKCTFFHFSLCVSVQLYGYVHTHVKLHYIFQCVNKIKAI